MLNVEVFTATEFSKVSSCREPGRGVKFCLAFQGMTGSPSSGCCWWLGSISASVFEFNEKYMQQKFFSFQYFSLSQFNCAQWNETHKKITLLPLFLCFWRDSPQSVRASSFTRFLNHTQRRTTFGRTPLDEGSARRRDLYLTTHNTHNRQTSMALVGFEPTISAGERPQTYALYRAATGTGTLLP